MGHHATLSDEALIHHYKIDAHPALLEELVQRHQVSVIRQCQRYIKNRDAAQDVSQEVFLRVLLKIPEFKGNASFATWLHTIIHNRCIDHPREDKKAMDLEISEHIAEPLQEEWDTDSTEEPTVPWKR